MQVMIDGHKIKEVAKQARIHLTEAELSSLAQDLKEVLSWAAELEEKVKEDIPYNEKPLIYLRKDEILQDADVKEILANAPQQDQNMFLAPRVL